MKMEENKIIRLRNLHKITSVITNPVRNPNTRQLPYSVRVVDQHNQIVYNADDNPNTMTIFAEDEELKIEDGQEFDLSKEYDRAYWEAIKYCPYIALNIEDVNGTDNDNNTKYGVSRYGEAEFVVDYPLEEDTKEVNKIELEFKAKTYIVESSFEKRLQVAKVLGRDMSSLSDVEIKSYLYGVCKSRPKDIINIFEGEDLKIRLLLIDAIARNVINRSGDILYYKTHNTILGASEDDAIKYLLNPSNKAITDLITSDTYPEYFKDGKEVNKIKTK